MKFPYLQQYYLALFIVAMLCICSGCTYTSASDGTKSPSNPVAGVQTSFGDMLSVRIPETLKSEIKNYSGFRLSFNAENHTPNWVAWELLGSETSGKTSRSNKFWTDDDIEGCPDTRDYSNSGFDRGHMCPAADNKLSTEMMDQSFVMTNMCPQVHSLNGGAWNTLEKKCRIWARLDSALYIVAGPIYDSKDTRRIGKIGVRVPSAFYKVIIAPYGNQPKGIAFIYPNMTAPGDMFQYAMPIDKAEEITGYDFFYNLPDDLENKIEQSYVRRQWDRN